MAQTPDAYLSALPEDRREALGAVRRTILEHLPDGYVEEIQYGMIGYVVPLARFPDTYNGQPLSLAALASQKRHMSLYMMGIYGGEDARSARRGRRRGASSTWARPASASAGSRTSRSRSSARRSPACRSTT